MTLVEVSSSKETCSHGEISKLKTKNRSTQYKTKQNEEQVHTIQNKTKCNNVTYSCFHDADSLQYQLFGCGFFVCVWWRGGRRGEGSNANQYQQLKLDFKFNSHLQA